MLENLIALIIGGLCGGVGVVMIKDPDLMAKYQQLHPITTVYENLPDPWNKRLMTGCGTVAILLAITIIAVFWFII